MVIQEQLYHLLDTPEARDRAGSRLREGRAATDIPNQKQNDHRHNTRSIAGLAFGLEMPWKETRGNSCTERETTEQISFFQVSLNSPLLRLDVRGVSAGGTTRDAGDTGWGSRDKKQDGVVTIFKKRGGKSLTVTF